MAYIFLFHVYFFLENLFTACGKDREWRASLELLNDMKKNSIIPNQHTYSAVINALGNNGQWERALEVLDQMREKEMKINVVTYNSAIAALAKASRSKTSARGGNVADFDKGKLWIKAMELLDQMKAEKVWPDKYSYSSTITCCSSGARYQEALDLIKVMRNGPSKVRPNKISYTGAMSKSILFHFSVIFSFTFFQSLNVGTHLFVYLFIISNFSCSLSNNYLFLAACARAGEWSHALRLFVDMKADRIKCDVFAYNALVSAFMNAGKPDMVRFHNIVEQNRTTK